MAAIILGIETSLWAATIAVPPRARVETLEACGRDRGDDA
jgi:hypothetical protein